MVEKSVYLFIGEDALSKQRKANIIKKEIVKERAADFDCEVLFADNLKLNSLKESLSRLPLQSKRRLIIIKNLEKLSVHNKKYLSLYVKKPYPHVFLILDANQINPKDKFISTISRFARTFQFKKQINLDVFDLGRKIIQKNTASALNILSSLYQKGENPTRILAGLLWQWENMKSRIALEEFRRGLQLFLETDLSIKTSRLDPEFALELLLVKLCSPAYG